MTLLRKLRMINRSKAIFDHHSNFLSVAEQYDDSICQLIFKPNLVYRVFWFTSARFHALIYSPVGTLLNQIFSLCVNGKRLNIYSRQTWLLQLYSIYQFEWNNLSLKRMKIERNIYSYPVTMAKWTQQHVTSRALVMTFMQLCSTASQMDRSLHQNDAYPILWSYSI